MKINSDDGDGVYILYLVIFAAAIVSTCGFLHLSCPANTDVKVEPRGGKSKGHDVDGEISGTRDGEAALEASMRISSMRDGEVALWILPDLGEIIKSYHEMAIHRNLIKDNRYDGAGFEELLDDILARNELENRPFLLGLWTKYVKGIQEQGVSEIPREN